jgi:glycolate oxidase
MEVVGEICLAGGAIDVWVADNAPAQKRLWEVRRSLLDALKALSRILEIEDVVVPRAQIPALVHQAKEISQKYSLPIICFGHAGDGNVHVHILRMDWEESRWQQVLPAVVEEIFQVAVTLGGTISGEHGIGCLKQKYLPLALGPGEIATMRRIKTSLDPANILNPGKIFE